MNETTLRLEVLSPPVAPVYYTMTFPAYRHLLTLQVSVRHEEGHHGPKREVQPLAVAALEGDEPVGLALAEIPLDRSDVPQLLSVFVNKEHRLRGIGSLLVQAVEVELKRRGFEQIRAVYMTGKAGADTMQRIFERLEWDAPVTRTVTIQCRIEEWARAPWLTGFRLNPEYEVFPWTELTDADRQFLVKSQEETHWIPDDLVPWKYDKVFEPVSSIGIRYRGEVIAWVLNHRISDDTVRFTCSFIRRELGRLGRSFAVFTESIRRLSATHYVYGVFTTPVQHKEMAALVRKWASTSSFFFGETKGIAKRLR
jgi:GNAT superfamily N-acetyltransferase